MIWPFKKRPTNVLGIDIGTSVIRIVELAKHGEQKKIENYGFVSLSPFYEKSAPEVRKDTLLLSAQRISEILHSILKATKTKTQKAVFSLPDFATFFTTFTLPAMSREEMPQAIKFEARRHVPLPLSEVTLDWMIVGDAPAGQTAKDLEILLVVVPNATVEQYSKVAELCHLDLLSLEAEAFGLSRALIKGDERVVVLIDIGAQSTTCSIIDQKKLKLSHSFDIAGNDLTERLSQSLDLDYETARRLKEKHGILRSEQKTRDVLLPLLDLILSEIGKVTHSFYQQEGKEIQAYIMAGGSALLPGLLEYFSESLKKEIKMADPFKDMVYPPILEDTLKKLGPDFAVATGMALRELE